MSLVGGTQVISWHLKKGTNLENTSRIESPARFHKGFGTCFFGWGKIQDFTRRNAGLKVVIYLSLLWLHGIFADFQVC